MHVGYSAFFQNLGRHRTDREVYRNEMRLACMAEPLGFESVWSTEHHFTDYLISPDVIQFLTYMAGVTEKALLGSMVVVLPWHDPIRVAEQVAMLDNLSGGRVVFGVGRGLGRVEFEGFRVPMSESREMFAEYMEMISAGLEQGFCEYEGRHIQQPRRDLRPAPFKSFKGRTFAATMSPDSMPVLARLGLGVMIIPQKPWSEVEKDFAAYNAIFTEANGKPAPAPIAATFICVDEDPSRAKEMAHRYIGNYYHSVMNHYELTAGHLANTKGYDFYHRVGQHIQRHGADKSATEFVELMPYGTPEQVAEKIALIHRHCGNNALVAAFSFGGMPYEEAEASMRLFAGKVMPELRRMKVAPLTFAETG